MSERKYVVPEGMWDAAQAAAAEVSLNGSNGSVEKVTRGLECALRWLAENPIVPSMEQVIDISKASIVDSHRVDLFVHYVCAEWQRRMFLAPEPRVSEVVKDLLWLDPPVDLLAVDDCGGAITQEANLRILEAYRRGRISHDEK